MTFIKYRWKTSIFESFVDWSVRPCTKRSPSAHGNVEPDMFLDVHGTLSGGNFEPGIRYYVCVGECTRLCARARVRVYALARARVRVYALARLVGVLVCRCVGVLVCSLAGVML